MEKVSMKVNDRVMMNDHGHDAWGVGEDNPQGEEGVILEVMGEGDFWRSMGFDCRVQWSNGSINSYSFADLDRLDVSA